MRPWQIVINSVDRNPLFPSEALLRLAVRTLVAVVGPWSALFCIVDDHAHVVVCCYDGEAPRLADALHRALQRLSAVPLSPPFLGAVRGRAHMESLLGYVPAQTSHHGIPVHPALWTGSCFVDLVGARLLPGFGNCIMQLLPRFRLRQLPGRGAGRRTAGADRPGWAPGVGAHAHCARQPRCAGHWPAAHWRHRTQRQASRCGAGARGGHRRCGSRQHPHLGDPSGARDLSPHHTSPAEPTPGSAPAEGRVAPPGSGTPRGIGVSPGMATASRPATRGAEALTEEDWGADRVERGSASHGRTRPERRSSWARIGFSWENSTGKAVVLGEDGLLMGELDRKGGRAGRGSAVRRRARPEKRSRCARIAFSTAIVPWRSSGPNS